MFARSGKKGMTSLGTAFFLLALACAALGIFQESNFMSLQLEIFALLFLILFEHEITKEMFRFALTGSWEKRQKESPAK